VWIPPCNLESNLWRGAGAIFRNPHRKRMLRHWERKIDILDSLLIKKRDWFGISEQNGRRVRGRILPSSCFVPREWAALLRNPSSWGTRGGRGGRGEGIARPPAFSAGQTSLGARENRANEERSSVKEAAVRPSLPPSPLVPRPPSPPRSSVGAPF